MYVCMYYFFNILFQYIYSMYVCSIFYICIIFCMYVYYFLYIYTHIYVIFFVCMYYSSIVFYSNVLVGLKDPSIIFRAFQHFHLTQYQWRARYEPGRSLFDPKRLHELGTQMFAIYKWCIEASKRGENWISVRIRQPHYFRGDDLIYVQFEELHQLCHLDTLDKSLVSCFCL